MAEAEPSKCAEHSMLCPYAINSKAKSEAPIWRLAIPGGGLRWLLAMG
jgi:hypothetical protein